MRLKLFTASMAYILAIALVEGFGEYRPTIKKCSIQRIDRLRTLLTMSIEEDAARAWTGVKRTLPPIITGAWTGPEGDHEPLGALYNLIFVRLVTLVCTVAYCKVLLDGGGRFSLDFGIGGPVEVPPFGVAIVIARILLPPL